MTIRRENAYHSLPHSSLSRYGADSSATKTWQSPSALSLGSQSVRSVVAASIAPGSAPARNGISLLTLSVRPAKNRPVMAASLGC